MAKSIYYNNYKEMGVDKWFMFDLEPLSQLIEPINTTGTYALILLADKLGLSVHGNRLRTVFCPHLR
jgi:hypothetical protein